MRIGEVEVLPVPDGLAVMPPTEAFAGTTDEMWAAHRQFLNAEGQLELELGGFLVRSGDRVVLVDAGVGRSFPPFEGGRLLGSLASHGVSPDQVGGTEALACAFVGAGESLANWWLEHPEETKEAMANRLIDVAWGGLKHLLGPSRPGAEDRVALAPVVRTSAE